MEKQTEPQFTVTEISDSTPEERFGHKDGEIVTNRADEKEKIVYDRNENGEVVGWHKEAVNG